MSTRMSCNTALAHVDAFLDGALPVALREQTLLHLRDCDECRGLFEALREPAGDPGMTESILARTSGSACERAGLQLCAFVDGELDSIDRELVLRHVEHCGDCAGLAQALETLRSALPELARLDPGPGFCEGVLARTTLRPARQTVRERMARFCASLVDRPRVAWEVAFVATVILVAPMLAPKSPLAVLPGRGLALLRNPVPERRMALAALRETVTDLETKLVGRAREAWATIDAQVVDDSVAAANTMARASTERWQAIRRRYGTIAGLDASRRTDDDAGPSERNTGTDEEKR